MTRRERYLKALRREQVEGLVWAPNLDYWYRVNKAEGTLPRPYRDHTRDGILRAIGATIWNRAGGVRRVLDPRVKETCTVAGDEAVTEIHTPVGVIRQMTRRTEGEHRARFLAEHYVKTLDDLRVMRYVVEATHFEPDYAPTEQALRETGDDGVVLTMLGCVPFIQFAKTDAGYQAAFLMWADHRDAVDGLVQAWHRLYLQAYRVLADGPADMVSTGDNMDGAMISPSMFREYAVPFYQEARRILAAKGKLFAGHWCGRTQVLLPHAPGCGLDVVEAVVSRPMAELELADALALLRGEVALQGGVPSVLVCEEGGTRAQFEQYIRDVVLPLRGRRGFILGMSDNVPPNADFARIEAVRALIGET